jgi:hypothetical protein
MFVPLCGYSAYGKVSRLWWAGDQNKRKIVQFFPLTEETRQIPRYKAIIPYQTGKTTKTSPPLPFVGKKYFDISESFL